MRRVGALVADAVDGLDLEAVEGVGQQVADQHPALGQAQLPRDEVHVVVTVGAGPPVGTALLAHDVVDDVTAAARLPGRVPLQDHRGLVDDGDHVPGAGGDACRHETQRETRQSTCSWEKPSSLVTINKKRVYKSACR